jgi:hypothetical protein
VWVLLTSSAQPISANASRYAMGGVPVRLRLAVRKFFCDNVSCRRRVFAERLEGVARRYARRTARQRGVLEDTGLALGGRQGARLVVRLGLRASRDTVLRLVRALPLHTDDTPRVLEVDGESHRRGADIRHSSRGLEAASGGGPAAGSGYRDPRDLAEGRPRYRDCRAGQERRVRRRDSAGCAGRRAGGGPLAPRYGPGRRARGDAQPRQVVPQGSALLPA